MNCSIRSLTAWLVAVSLAITTAPAYGDMVDTAAALRSDRERIAAFLAQPEAQAQLRAHGVEAADARARVAAMTDEEAAQIAARVEVLSAGGYALPPLPPEVQLVFIAVAVALILVIAGTRALVKAATKPA